MNWGTVVAGVTKVLNFFYNDQKNPPLGGFRDGKLIIFTFTKFTISKKNELE